MRAFVPLHGGPHEKAFLEVLTEVRVLRDTTIDTAAVYDLVARFDPERYHDPSVGMYPLRFEDQFILWGKRVSLFTRSTTWTSRRFYLHDISTARQAWIFTEDTRILYKPPTRNLPPSDPSAFPRWLELIYSVDPHTPLRSMGRWLRLMHDESRDQVMARARKGRARTASDTTQGGP